MAATKADDRLDELDGVMRELGFRRALDRSKSAQELKQLHGVRYADPKGNVFDLNFTLQVSRGGSGLMIETLFNSGSPRSWKSFDSLFEGLPSALKEWVKAEEDPTSPAEAKPPREFRAASPAAAPQKRPAAPAAGKDRIAAKHILQDVKAGVSDQDLMTKYRLSHRRLLSVISKLVWDGLLTQQELADRRAMARTVFMPVYQCRLCKAIQLDKGGDCPNCGGPMRMMNKRGPEEGGS